MVRVEVGGRPDAVEALQAALTQQGLAAGARRRPPARHRRHPARRGGLRHRPRRRRRARPPPLRAVQPPPLPRRALRPGGHPAREHRSARSTTGATGPTTASAGGRGATRWALWRLTVRRALGLRRSWRQKVLPWTLLGLATIPAAIDLGIRYATRDTPLGEIDYEFLTFRDYVGVSTMLLLFVAVSAPDVICPDRHDRVLPLIFARPLTGDDYVLAKVGGIFSLVFGFSFLPQVVLYIGQMLLFDDGAARVPGRPPGRALEGAAGGGDPGPLLRGDRRGPGVAHRPADRRRPGLPRASSSSRRSSRGSSPRRCRPRRTTLIGVFNLLQLPLMLRDLVFEGRVDVDNDTEPGRRGRGRRGRRPRVPGHRRPEPGRAPPPLPGGPA